MPSLVIVGTSGNAYDMLDIVEAKSSSKRGWRAVGFIDDLRTPGSSYLGLPVVGRIDQAGELDNQFVFVNAIGSDRSYRSRPAIVERTGLPGKRWATIVHPLASVSSRATIGRGVSIHAGASVGGGAIIGDHVQLSPGCIIGHDSVIEDYAVVAPGAVVSGYVKVGRNCYVGAGAMIRQQQRLGEAALVGMGAVVINDVMPGSIVVGNPARELVKTQGPRATTTVQRA